MSVSNHKIDLTAVQYAIDHYIAEIPTELQNQLLAAIDDCQSKSPGSLVNLIIDSETLDRLYEKALTEIRRQDIQQERAKNLSITADAQFPNLSNSLPQEIHQLLYSIAQRLTQHQHQTLTTAKETILKKLTTTPLRTQDLSYILNQPLDRTQTIVQQLWKSGYIDRLDSGFLPILIPSLRNPSYRHQSIDPNLFLTVTTKGYSYLYPIIQWAKRGER
jgi:hypothetical protein